MTFPIPSMVIPYPDFKMGEVIDPEQHDQNNARIAMKVNEIASEVNRIVEELYSYDGADKLGNAPPPTLSTGTIAKQILEVVQRLLLLEQNGAEPNQNAFANINGVTANQKSAIVEFVGGVGVRVTPNPANRTITIEATGDALPGAHVSSHMPGGADAFPIADGNQAGLMSPSHVGGIADYWLAKQLMAFRDGILQPNLNAQMFNGIRIVTHADIGLAISATMTQIAEAMPNQSIFIYVKDSTTALGDFPHNSGTLYVYRRGTSRIDFIFSGGWNTDNYTYRAFYQGSAPTKFSGWKKVAFEGTNAIFNTLTATGMVAMGAGLSIMHNDSSHNQQFKFHPAGDGHFYLQTLQRDGTWIANPIRVERDGFMAINNGLTVSYKANVNGVVRNMHISTSAPTASNGVNGDVWIQYE